MKTGKSRRVPPQQKKASVSLSSEKEGGSRLLARWWSSSCVRRPGRSSAARCTPADAPPPRRRPRGLCSAPLPSVPLPEDIVKRFDNRTIAITGYEQDQVIKGENGTADQSVPIYWAYNHHYVSWLKALSHP